MVSSYNIVEVVQSYFPQPQVTKLMILLMYLMLVVTAVLPSRRLTFTDTSDSPLISLSLQCSCHLLRPQQEVPSCSATFINNHEQRFSYV